MVTCQFSLRVLFNKILQLRKLWICNLEQILTENIDIDWENSGQNGCNLQRKIKWNGSG